VVRGEQRRERKSVLPRRLGRLIGSAFFVVGLCRYRSYSDCAVLGLWSYSFLLVLVVASALLALAAASSWRATVRGAANLPTPAARLRDLGILCWGAAYLLGAMDSPAMAGRVLGMNLFGSLFAPAAALDWVALVLFFLAGAFAVSQRGGKWIELGLVVGSFLSVYWRKASRARRPYSRRRLKASRPIPPSFGCGVT